MKLSDITPSILEKANLWMGENFDAETRKQVKHLMDENPDELFSKT